METRETIVPVPALASLPEPKSRWRSFSVGFLVQVLLLVFCTETTISFMAPVLNPVDTSDNVHLVAPQLSPQPPEPESMAKVREIPIPRVVRAPMPPRQQTLPLVDLAKPKIEVAQITPATPPAPLVETDTFRNAERMVGPKVSRTSVATNFGGSSTPVTDNKSARTVQTGGFGDPNGVPPNPNTTGKGPMIAKVGSFDLPEGAGSGGGIGGTKGIRGTVGSAGFGNGMAVQNEGGSGGTSGPGRVRSTNFGSMQPPSSDAPKRQAVTGSSKDAPVALLSKPTPSYTLEARQRKIEGDVEVDVEFTATGQVHVLRVVQGLGYGLDEAAVKAAEQIRFAPARRDGQPVDARGRLRIVFRLS